LSPHGTEDLFRMIVRCPPEATSREVERFTERLRKKSWSSTWPKVVVVSPPDDKKPHDVPCRKLVPVSEIVVAPPRSD
jgi:hypothetical protein